MKHRNSDKFTQRKNTFAMKESKSTWFRIEHVIFRQCAGATFLYVDKDIYYSVTSQWIVQRFGWSSYGRQEIDTKWLKLRGWL